MFLPIASIAIGCYFNCKDTQIFEFAKKKYMSIVIFLYCHIILSEEIYYRGYKCQKYDTSNNKSY